MDAIINERVLDIGFRADLERKQGFCRRHVAELVPTDRRETGGILGSSMLLSAVIDRRIGLVRDGVGSRGRRIRVGLELAADASAVHRVHAGRDGRPRRPSDGSPSGRVDAAWADTLGEAAFCLDDFLLLWDRAGSQTRVRTGGASSARPIRGPAPAARRLRPPFQPRPGPADDRRGTDAPPTRRRASSAATAPRIRRTGPWRISNDPRVVWDDAGVEIGSRRVARERDLRRPANRSAVGSRGRETGPGCHGVPSIGRT